MATSGSYDFSVSRDDIIEEALMALGVIGEGEAPTANQLTDHSRTLNAMVKRWVGRGINLWAIDRVTVFLETDKSEYIFGTDHICATSDIIETALAADAAAAAGSISVDSITGLAASDHIGIVLDDGTIQWTTINGAPSGSTVTLTTALTGAASENNPIYTYTTKYTASYPREVINAWRRDSNDEDVPVNPISRDEYYRLGDKNADGAVNQFYFKAVLGATPSIFVYPQSSEVTDTLELNVKRSLADFDAASDTPDFPQEWYEALYLGLAHRLSNHYGKALGERQWLKGLADEALLEAEGYDVEQGVSTFFTPDTRDE
jgi:hypothetical protein